MALTVLGRPAWARNCSYSGQMSGNLSSHGDEPCGGEGLSPGYWKTHYADWHANWPPSQSFEDVFMTGVFDPWVTLGDVIQGDNGLLVPEDGNRRYVNVATALGFHAVAALQNAATPVRYDLTVSEVIASVQAAYRSRDVDYMETTKTTLDTLNNQSMA